MRLYNDRFRLEEEIRSGGFATVWRATESGHDAPLALKIGRVTDDPDLNRSIIKEAEVLQRLHHANIVRLFLLPRDDRAPIAYARAVELPGHPYFFAMEYLAGGTLGDMLKEFKKLPLPEAAAIALSVARALDHMHKEGYAHNDLKLENIVFRYRVVAGQAYSPTLIDFGIAMRRVQVAAGSIYSMPPEVLAQAKMLAAPEIVGAIDPTKVDVWGMGVLLYQLLGGRLPFEGRDERTVTSRIFKSRPQSLLELSKEIPAEIDNVIIDGCLAKNSAYRLSLMELGQILRRWGEDVVASRDFNPGRKRRLW